MKIKHKKFTSFLVPLRSVHIEQIRLWRNQDSIKKWMEFQKTISKEEQKSWYNNLKNTPHHYFEIWHKNQFIGLIYLKFLEKEAFFEAGLFIGNEKFHGTGAALEASLLLLHWAIEMHIAPIFAKVHKDHKNAILYNQYLGFEIRQEKGDFLWMEWNKNIFLKNFEKMLFEN